MTEWLVLIVLSAFAGFVCALIFSGKVGFIFSGVIPWLGLLAWLLYHEYFMPYQGGGASMWPVAQLFAGTIVAATGVGVYILSKHLTKRKL